MCFVCLSLYDSGQGDNRLVFRGAKALWGSWGKVGGGGWGGGGEGEVFGGQVREGVRRRGK